MPTAMILKEKGGVGTGLRLGEELRDFAGLRARVEEVLIAGRRRIEKEFLVMRYQTGVLINEHIRLNDDRAEYGAKALLRLSEEFDIDESELRRYSVFARAYPIQGSCPELSFNLSWSCYRKLIVIKEDKRRWALTLEAEKNEWSLEQVDAKVRRALELESDAEKNSSRLPTVPLGPFLTYPIVALPDVHSGSSELLLDLGFHHRIERGLLEALKGSSLPLRFREGMIVRIEEGDGTYRVTEAKGAGEESLYTYRAKVEEIVDGDTLKVNFLLGLGNRKGETIRLNHIDCPEMNTAEGRAAKRFVERELAGCESITIKSTRTRKEKWGRYLGDVFYEKKGTPGLIYLNQLLLDKNHAVRIRE